VLLLLAETFLLDDVKVSLHISVQPCFILQQDGAMLD